MTTAQQIVTRAFNELMYFAEGEPVTAQALNDGLDHLNGLLSSFHTIGLSINYPPGVNWRGEWAGNILYAANDGVSLGGNTYTCILTNTSTDNDKPGKSINSGTYWTLYAETPMGLTSTFFLPAQHERGVVSMLALEIAPSFNVQPSPFTVAKAKQGEQALYGQYFNIPLAPSDAAITKMPSQIWPYTIPNVSN